MKNILKKFIALLSFGLATISFAGQPTQHKQSSQAAHVQGQMRLKALRDSYSATAQSHNPQLWIQYPHLLLQSFNSQIPTLAALYPEIYEFLKHEITKNFTHSGATAPLTSSAAVQTASTKTAQVVSNTNAQAAAKAQAALSQLHRYQTEASIATAVGSSATAAGSTATAAATAVQPGKATATRSSEGSKASTEQQSAEQIRPIAFVGSYICVSNNYQYAITISSQGALCVYDLKSQQYIYKVKNGVKPESSGFACDNQCIYYALNNGTLAIYNMNNKQFCNVVGKSAKMSSDSKWLAISSDGMNATQNNIALIYLPTMMSHDYQGAIGEFSPSSKRFFFRDTESKEIVFVDLVEQNSQATAALNARSIECVKNVSKLKIHENDQTFIVNDEVLFTLDPAMVFSLSCQKTICVNGDIVAQELQKFSLLNNRCAVRAQNIAGIFMDITADGSRILLHRDNKVFERIVYSGAEQFIGECTFPEAQYTFDGSHVMLRSYAGDMQFISLATKESVFGLKDITRADFSADYSLMALESRNFVLVYNPKDGKFIKRVEGSFYSFENNILITAGTLADENDRNYFAYDFQDYLCKTVVPHKSS